MDKGKCKKVLPLPKRRVNEVYWPSKEGRLVITNVDPTRRAGDDIEFVDVRRYGRKGKYIETVEVVHETVTHIEWDPTGATWRR